MSTNLPPAAPTKPETEYVGFWLRVVAALLDTLWVLALTVPLVLAVYGWRYFQEEELVRGPADLLISYVLPAVLVIAFWSRKLATPGKMAIGAKIVDARTGAAPSLGQLVIRYLGYFVSTIPLGAGLLWVAIDRRKQGWHDKLAGTVVVRSRR